MDLKYLCKSDPSSDGPRFYPTLWSQYLASFLSFTLAHTQTKYIDDDLSNDDDSDNTLGEEVDSDESDDEPSEDFDNE